MTAVPTLMSERLILRTYHPDDHEAVSVIRAKDGVGRHVGGVKSSQETWAMMALTQGIWAFLGYGYWAVCLRKTGEIIGETGFADFKREMSPSISGAPEAGWVIDEPHWGKGYATEAVTAAHGWMDEQIAPARTVCIIDPEHTPSINVAHKLGYKEIGLSKYKEDDVMVFERQSAG